MAFILAAFIHIARYVLLLVNRTTLLPPLVANVALLLGVIASLAAVVAVVVTAIVLTSWLISRRSAAYRHRNLDDPRPVWALRSGCLVPIANLVWAPVFMIELAHAENSHIRLRPWISLWWVGWVFSTLVSIFAIATSFTTEPQGIADNTVLMIIAYLLGATVVLVLWRVFDGFVRRPVERPLHRWVIAGADRSADTGSPAAVGQERQEPAA